MPRYRSVVLSSTICKMNYNMEILLPNYLLAYLLIFLLFMLAVPVIIVFILKRKVRAQRMQGRKKNKRPWP
jgi:UDP-N-acetylmuramyl pentapeptide phosphotransferase/UDP-N-acetylglucosamine-1-phosphate transferase